MSTPEFTEQLATDSEKNRKGRAELELAPKRGLHTGRPAYEEFTTDMRALIKRSIMPQEATDADLYYLLEIAATYRLDPFSREIWAVKMPGKNASGSGVIIMVGRDGMLAIAERHRDYRGFRNQAVYANDTFLYSGDPRAMPDGSYSHVKHEFSVTEDRGELLGAYAEVYREGRPPVFFFAKLAEYKKTGDYSPWSKQETVMIEKCALSTALRISFRISGLYLADEITNAPLVDKQRAEALPAGAEMNLGDDPDVAKRLRALLDVLSELEPENYLPGKQKLMLAPLDAEGRVALIEKLEEAIVGHGVELPVMDVLPDEIEAEAVEVIDDDAEKIEFAPQIPRDEAQTKLVD